MEGASPAASLEDLVRALVPPRVVWMMIPAGDPVEQMLASVMELVQPGDIVMFDNRIYHAAFKRKDGRGRRNLFLNYWPDPLDNIVARAPINFIIA